MCVNDITAQRIMSVLEKRGLRIPEDIAISGFDNMEPIIPSHNILTTVDFSAEKLGMMAANCLLMRIKYPDSPYSVSYVESHVIYRKTTGD